VCSGRESSELIEKPGTHTFLSWDFVSFRGSLAPLTEENDRRNDTNLAKELAQYSIGFSPAFRTDDLGSLPPLIFFMLFPDNSLVDFGRFLTFARFEAVFAFAFIAMGLVLLRFCINKTVSSNLSDGRVKLWSAFY
jgi:hypothetical protein